MLIVPNSTLTFCLMSFYRSNTIKHSEVKFQGSERVLLFNQEFQVILYNETNKITSD